jgi:alkanesulfonate monooxygenase SsuD/methylene tetrahydromethanopterin reductase-like flavin-dependent oxidoreductase (luciferase family)
VPRFSLRELQQSIVAANASPVGFVHLLAKQHGEDAEIERDEIYQHALRAATGYSVTFAGTAQQLADRMEEMFEATGKSRRLHVVDLAGGAASRAVKHGRLSRAGTQAPRPVSYLV